jgi:hypothetical protein
MPFPTIGEAARNFVADAVKLRADAPGGFWDRLSHTLISCGWVRDTQGNRLFWFTLLSYLGATAQKNFSESTFIGKAAQELISDAASELPKRFYRRTP